MAVSIQIENLVKKFGQAVALDGVSIEIEPGELFFLLGPSGCGKTTLLRHIAGFYRPDSGRILIGGQDVTNQPPHKRDTGMVFQSYALWPHMTLAENVAFGLEMRKVPKPEIAKRVARALAAVQMEDKAGRKPNQLSGGQPCARLGGPAALSAAGRAAFESRCKAAPGDADGNPAHLQGVWPDGRLRDARPEGGAVYRR